MGSFASEPALRGHGKGLKQGTWTIVALAIGPLILSYGIFLIFPMIYAFVMSFTNWNPVSMRTPLRAVGVANYSELLFKDPLFWTSLKNTIYYAALRVPAGLVISMVLATLINSLRRLKGFYRSIYYLPVLTSTVAAAIMWNWIYQPRFGLLNSVLASLIGSLGLQVSGMPRYLMDAKMAMPSIAVMSLWKGIGYDIVIFLAGLQGIPSSMYDAAKVDGATGLQAFWHVTVPLLRPTIAFIAITGVIGSLQVFTEMYIMTQGGPVNSTRTIVYMLFDQAFDNSRFGYASAISFVLFAVIMAITLLQRRVLATEWAY